MKINKPNIAKFQTKVLQHYYDHGRNLPWRNTSKQYHIFLSEIMAQQTQVSRVIPKYKLFLEEVASFYELANISKEKLFGLRSGLGYNNRAIRMQQAASVIIKKHDGQLPKDYDSLMALPGIGEYTASALLAFVYNKDVPVIDINIKRVLIHTFDRKEKPSKDQLQTLAYKCIPIGKSRIRHNALMDYGAMVLTSKITGIKSPKQSKFHGSTRWVRGSILKELIKNKSAQLHDLKEKYPHDTFIQIIEQMKKEKLIQQTGRTLSISK